MKTPRIVTAMGSVDDDLIAEAADCVPARRSSRKWLRIAACIVLAAIALGAVMYHNTPANPFVVTVYAQESDGSLTPCVIRENEGVLLSKIVTADGFEGYLFSYPLEDPTKTRKILPLLVYAPTREGNPIAAFFDIIEPYGLQYFFYIPTQETAEEMPLIMDIYINHDSSIYRTDSQQDYYQMEFTLSENGCYVFLKKAVQGMD